MTDKPRYPISLRLDGLAVLVAGGGVVATRKVARLVECGARVRVVAPDAAAAIRRLAESGALAWERRRVDADADTAGCALVFAATDDPAANDAVARAARARGIPVNRADDPDDCDFLVPALVRRGAVSIAVDTAGTAPALAKWLARRLEAAVGDEIGAVAGWFAEVRREVTDGGISAPQRAALLARILSSPAADAAAAGRHDEAMRIAREIIAASR